MTCQELLDLRENYQFEVKSAQGRDGNGEVPKDVWESYSAMANSEGGLILLGAKELKDGSLEFLGIKEIDKIQKEFWTTINNNQKVNLNILSPTDVEVLVCENKNLLLISKDDLFQGGKSDCRNRVLQKMFQYIGMGEQAGSGYPKILRAWIEQHWQYPNVQLQHIQSFPAKQLPQKPRSIKRGVI
jgi:predicted HTH transcriptional regulator